MKPLRRHKKYKNRRPEETISIIQSILKNKLELGTYERAFNERNGLFFSCRLLLDNGDWLRSLNIGTNGKGMTENYSCASAYGELMERLQNGALMRYHIFGSRKFQENAKECYPLFCELLKEKRVISPYLYSWDEYIDPDEQRLYNSISQYVCTTDNKLLFEKTKGMEHYYVPYYSVKNDEIVTLPFDIINNNISTNGLCAGNTPKEAMIEGLSEIFERYVIRKIYFDNLSLPRIPKAYFEGNQILHRIENLERTEHYTIEIVDCSLGKGIPALGVVILTDDSKEYQFHMAVDPSPITALERSLTELFQGRSCIKFKPFDQTLQRKLDTDFVLKEIEMLKTHCASIGHYPLSFFSDTPSYEFSGFNDSLGFSDDEDLQYLVELIDNLGYQLFVRDNSFLGFPAYSLYVPGMTELHNIYTFRHFETTYELYSNEPDKDFMEMFGSWNDVVNGNNHKFIKYLKLIKQIKEQAVCNPIDQASLQTYFK